MWIRGGPGFPPTPPPSLDTISEPTCRETRAHGGPGGPGRQRGPRTALKEPLETNSKSPGRSANSFPCFPDWASQQPGTGASSPGFDAESLAEGEKNKDQLMGLWALRASRPIKVP